MKDKKKEMEGRNKEIKKGKKQERTRERKMNEQMK